MTGFYKDYADSSDTHQNSAEASADAAESAKLIAENAASIATTKAVEATNAAGQAAASEAAALASQSSASASATSASTDADDAEDSATEAAASALAASNSATTAQNLEITSASFDTADGTLTLTKANSGTVTTDLDGRYLTTHQDISGKADLSGATFTGDVSFGDDVKAKFGDSDDLLIYHDSSAGSRSIIKDAGTGFLDLITNGSAIRFMTDEGDYMFYAYKNGGVTLLHDSYIKLQTTVDGIRVWDDAQFDTNINVDGNATVGGELTVTGSAEAELFKGDLEGAVHFKGHVASGATLVKGDVVYVSGHSGLKTQVDLADASDSNKMPAFGIVAANPVGQNVDVVTFGTLKSINTSSYTDGDELYVSTTAGQLTATAPSGESNLVQKIAKVVRAHNSGNIKIMGAGRTNATPNLNSGNFFLGDINNQAVTASFTTAVAASEIDPIFSAHASSGITATQIDHWDDAYGWDDHSTQGYLTTHQDISGKANLSGATFTGNVNIGIPPSGTQSLTVAGTTDLYGGLDLNLTSITGVDTLTAKNVDISTAGSVTTNIATGGIQNLGDTKTLNLGTGFSSQGTTTVNVGASTGNINLNGEINENSNTTFGGNIVFTDSSHLMTVDGRDVSVDGAKLDTLERVYRTRFRHRNSELSTFQSLTNAMADIGNPIYTKSTTGSENTLDFFLATTCSDYYDNNDGNIEVVVTAPTPSDEDVVNLGMVTGVVSNTPSGQYNFDVVGDVTKHLTDYCGLSVNSDGSNAFLYGQVRSNAYYNPSTNKTTISCNQYQSNKVVNGGTVYLHPFDWETSGTAIIGNRIQIDEVVYNAQKMSRKDFSAYLGYFKSSVTVKIRGKEASSSTDNIAIRKMEGTLTQVQD